MNVDMAGGEFVIEVASIRITSTPRGGQNAHLIQVPRRIAVHAVVADRDGMQDTEISRVQHKDIHLIRTSV